MATDSVRHQLAVAVRFVDVFTVQPVVVPLDVRVDSLPSAVGMPAVPWRAVEGPNDHTYRFLVSNNTVMPTGTVGVAVTARGQEYVDFEPLTTTLPRVLTAHPPIPARSDYLLQHPLWPTRSLRLPPRDTAIVARLVSAGSTPIEAVRATIWPDGSPMPAFPYAYSDARGEFVYRLPALKTVVGGVITPTANLLIDLRLPPAYTAVVLPTQVTSDTGAVLGIPFSVRLGRVSNVTISLP
jgi:hypothetical protein